MECCSLRARIKEAFSGGSSSGLTSGSGSESDVGITRRAGYGDGGEEGIFWEHKGSKKVNGLVKCIGYTNNIRLS